MTFSGIIPAVITPFTDSDAIDTEALTQNVTFLVEHGVTGFVVNGTMGEASSLSHAERRLTSETVVAAASGLPVIAGISASSTADARHHATVARETGCAGVMVLPPILYAGTDAEFIAFFKEVAAAAQLPVILYNNPEASGLDISARTVTRIAETIPEVTAVKECSGDARRIAELRGLCDISILAGGDDWALEAYAAGADGWITGTGNVAPTECVDLQEHVRAGRMGEARELYQRLLPLLRLDLTPHLVQYYKAAMDSVGLRGGSTRPPRLALNPDQQGLLDAAMRMLEVPSPA